MRFVIAAILVVLSGVIALANAQGMTSLGTLLGYIFGSVIIGPALIAALFCIPKSGRNNKRFFRAFNVVVLLSIIAGVGQFASVYGAPPKTIADKKGYTEITIPGSWEIGQKTADNILFNFADRPGSMTIIVGYEEYEPGTITLEEYSALIVSQLEENPGFVSMSEAVPCEHEQFVCFYQIVTMSFDNTNTDSVVASLEGNGKFYNYIATSSSRTYERNKDVLFSALSSFHEL